ncbi:MAG TPA: hypothetical protein VJL58_11945, partial [Pyrinomonadaceae bacterium]|nr:hypothetical protein [Pyrinomonadaceae bacterium]
EIDNWAFNPGSIEVTNIAEFREMRGVFLVDVDQLNNVSARHIQDYRQRPFQRIPVDVDGAESGTAITERVLEKVRTTAQYAVENEPAPIIEITLRGQLGIPNSLIESKDIREKIQEITGALHVRLKNQSVPVEYAVAADVEEDAGREKLERRVIEDLVFRDNRYKNRPMDIAEAVIGAKRLALSDEEPERIAEFIALKAVEDLRSEVQS